MIQEPLTPCSIVLVGLLPPVVYGALTERDKMQLTIEKPLRKYESILILHPDCTEEEQKEFFRKNKGILSDFNGEYECVETWGKRRLGNAINK